MSVAQWEENLKKASQLEAEQEATAITDARRKQLLEDEMNDALDLAEKLQSEDGYFGEHKTNMVLLIQHTAWMPVPQRCIVTTCHQFVTIIC